MDHVPTHPRERVRMKCAFGHLSVGAAASDEPPLGDGDRERFERIDGLPRGRVHVRDEAGDAVAERQPPTVVRRRSRLASLEPTA